jgi:hypothetical protein
MIDKSNGYLKSSQIKLLILVLENSHLISLDGVAPSKQMKLMFSVQKNFLHYLNIVYEDTCTIDYFLLALWAISK